MSKVTIIIDSDDDDDVVEILECAPSIKPSSPMTKASTSAVLPQSNKRRGPDRPTPSVKASNVTNTNAASKPIPKPQAMSSSKAPLSKASSSKASTSSASSSPKSKVLPKSTPVQPAKPTASSSRPLPSPNRAKVQQIPTARPKASIAASSKRPTITKIRHINPIPASVVTYTSETTRKPSANPVPLNGINKLFQRDARTVTLEKASRRASSGLSKSPSSVDISKKFEMDKELAAIFASNSPQPSPSTSAPSLTSTTTSSQPIRPSPSATMDKRPVVSSSPPRQVHGNSSNGSGSQERRKSSLFSPNALDSPPAPTRKRPISSPQNASLFSRPAFSKKKVIYGIDDEDGEEENLELYINHVSSKRKLFSDELKEAERRQIGNKQCPLCYMLFPKQEIMDHSFECDGRPTDKGLKKRTIGTAVALNAAERKRKNAGVLDTGPTNYYADSDGALALDGSGFGSEVTGLSWESAGQTRFA
ncbi:hypothetical protein FB192DRAFT_1459693 [Mucor lusitanicus]|nr:hypothetical protein FB192DRAFT_1459693 [Mucor lusitanicus]